MPLNKCYYFSKKRGSRGDYRRRKSNRDPSSNLVNTLEKGRNISFLPLAMDK